MSEDINVGAISEALNNKLDLDGNNKVIPNGLTSIGFPSSRHIDLTLGASGTTYTAPANGYFNSMICPNNTGYTQSWLTNFTSSLITWQATPHVTFMGNIMPVKKGDIVELRYVCSGDVRWDSAFRFVYAEGEQ